MADSGKRKATRDAEGGASKKKKKGNSGKWKVPKGDGPDRPKANNTIEPGDVGIWVTCPLHMKGKAAREMELLFDDYAEKIYGIKTEADDDDDDDDEEGGGDIENAIRKEIGELKDKRGGVVPGGPGAPRRGVFAEVRINQECILFTRCMPPVEPVAFCRRICTDAATVGHDGGARARSRYLNRLTPVSVMVKASDGGVEEGARRALAGHFKLKPREAAGAEGKKGEEGEEEAVVDEEKKESPATYAIRPSIRNHNTLKRDDVIKLVANLVDSQHKVNLGAPDKVILIEIYQTVCGFSVVPGDWESLKRYNLTELYKQSALGSQDKGGSAAAAVVAAEGGEKST